MLQSPDLQRKNFNRGLLQISNLFFQKFHKESNTSKFFNIA